MKLEGEISRGSVGPMLNHNFQPIIAWLTFGASDSRTRPLATLLFIIMCWWALVLGYPLATFYDSLERAESFKRFSAAERDYAQLSSSFFDLLSVSCFVVSPPDLILKVSNGGSTPIFLNSESRFKWRVRPRLSAGGTSLDLQRRSMWFQDQLEVPASGFSLVELKLPKEDWEFIKEQPPLSLSYNLVLEGVSWARGSSGCLLPEAAS